MPVSTRVRDKGVYEYQSLDPHFCVEVPWCSGSLLPLTFFSTIINTGGGAGATGSVTSTTTLSVQSPLSASNSGSTTILAITAPPNTILGNSGSDGAPASFISFLSAQTTSATTQADPNDVYFGTFKRVIPSKNRITLVPQVIAGNGFSNFSKFNCTNHCEK